MSLRCAVPLLFEGADFGLALKASGFLATFRSRLFLVTTKHGLLGRAAEADTLPNVRAVLCYRKALLAIPRDAFVLEALSPVDTEIGDVCIVALGKNWATCDCVDCPRPMPIDDDRPTQIAMPARVYARGFPDVGSHVDYERKHASIGAYDLRGQFVGVTDRDGVFELCFEGNLPDMNGFSGSPVILDAEGRQHLLGMLHRGSADGGRAYCLDVSNIRTAIARAVDEWGAKSS